MRKVVVLLLGAIMLLASVAFAANDFAGESMSIGVGARPLGMGGTFAAIASDASTSYWNAAGMTNVQGVEVSSVKLMKINDLETKYSYVNLVYNVSEEIGALGLGWLRQSIGGIQLSDIFGEKVGDGLTENSDNTIYFAYAKSLVKGFSMGTSVKVLLGNYPAVVLGSTPGSSEPTEVTYTGFGLDIGLFLNVGDLVKDIKGLSLGLNVQDVYTTIAWEASGDISSGEAETVGMNLKPGIAYTLPIDQFAITAAVDLDTRYEQMIVHAGGELWWNNMVAVRGGIKSYGGITAGEDTLSQEMDWSLGASLRWYFIGVDYAYVYNELTPVQYLSIIGKF